MKRVVNSDRAAARYVRIYICIARAFAYSAPGELLDGSLAQLSLGELVYWK